ncbi:FecR family protein [Oceanobacter kriegii]|uniref:FecR family protein n=1 Tax=Oceanobacter kriegii TaxID=64972 RepID=UPI00040D443C|nr:FecR domain-containing protein [Oceanobacter kriegii]
MDNATCPDALADEAFAMIRDYYDADTDGAAAVTKQHMETWCQQSEQHRLAMEQASEEWHLMGALSQVAERPPYTHKAEASWLAQWLTPVRLMQAGSAFAVILMLAILVPSFWNTDATTGSANIASSQANRQQDLNYQTRLQSVYGEIVTRTLPDGSTVSLNWDSEVAVNFSAGQRSLTLIRGEAYFEVAHDTSRPFIVSAGQARARAVGTAFNVRADSGKTRIAVTEGTVAVTGSSRSTTLVNASEKVAVTDGQTGAVSPSANLQATAWQQGSMIFDGQPLADVLDEINRYTQYQIDTRFLPNPEAPVSATYFISRTDEAVRSLMQLFNLRADMRNGIDGPRLVLRARLGR